MDRGGVDGGERSGEAFAAAGEKVSVPNFSEDLVVVDVNRGVGGDCNGGEEEDEEEAEGDAIGVSRDWEIHVDGCRDRETERFGEIEGAEVVDVMEGE